MKALANLEREWRKAWGRDISTPGARWRARVYCELLDHGVLRRVWTNFDRLDNGVWRSNHPTAGRLRRMAAQGLRSVINLRGDSEWAHNQFEIETCAELGLAFHSVSLSARQAPPADELFRLIDLLRRVERPVLLHCKSGADRAGLASAIYLLIQGRPLSDARAQLSFRYLHLHQTKTGVLDAFLDAYAPFERNMSFETWLRDHYDQAALQASFSPKWG